MKARFLLLSLVFYSAIGVAPAFALKVVPFVAEFEPKGSGANQTFRVENDTNQSVAVQLSMVHREMTVAGQDQLTDAENDFVVFPPQLVLMPNEARAVRVQWLGDPAPKSELVYRLIVEQLPVDLNPQQRGGQVRITVRYETSIYVVPPGAKGSLSIEKAEAVKGANGATMLALTVHNGGNAHVLIDAPTITLRGAGDKSIVLSKEDQLKGMVSENVLGGHTRQFMLPWPRDLPPGPVEASIKVGAVQ